MATDATGAPTSLGIPKYNTSADAPSGLGFNAAMDSIDALLASRVSKPASIATGEVPVWNGSAWVRSTTTNVGPTSLGSGTPDATKFLRGDGSWQVATPPDLHYSEVTGTTNITGTAEGAATAVLAGSSVAYDGTAVWLEFWAYAGDTGGGTLQFGFYDGTTSLGFGGPGLAGTYYPLHLRRKYTPSAASHTFNVKAWVTSGTGHVYAGAGGAGAALPAYLRITKA